MLTRRSPFIFRLAEGTDSFGPVLREMDALMRDVAQGKVVSGPAATPPADVIETSEGIRVSVDLPGHDPSSIEVKLEDNVLTIRSERRLEKAAEGETVLRRERAIGNFSRSFGLPQTVDPNRVEAKLELGVLTVTLPRREEAKPRVIDVQVKN